MNSEDKYCPYCGKKRDGNDRICHSCGSKIRFKPKFEEKSVLDLKDVRNNTIRNVFYLIVIPLGSQKSLVPIT